jgi:putative ABC transport system permease protein
VWVDTQFEDASREIFGPEEAYTERFIAVLVLAAFAFMALPALNLVTLSMSRTLERAAEIGVRRAFGASRGALVTQLLLETLVLTAFGAVIAVVLAQGTLMVLASAGWVPGSTITIGPRTLAITALITVVFALLSGALPAWRMARLDPVVALSGRTTR